MGENEIIMNTNYCRYAYDRRDCDGDWDTYCTSCRYCQYKYNVKDCDDDIISLCRK